MGGEGKGGERSSDLSEGAAGNRGVHLVQLELGGLLENGLHVEIVESAAPKPEVEAVELAQGVVELAGGRDSKELGVHRGRVRHIRHEH